MRKWKIDEEGFAKAKDLLNISLPVRVRILDGTNSFGSLTGKYHGIGHWGITSEERLDEPAHHITIDGKMSLSSANEILWHEMTHASQAEDYLPEEAIDGVEPYRIANKGMRMAFLAESRSLRATPTAGFGGKSYFDVSFEKEARFFMKNGEAIDILAYVFDEEDEEEIEEEEVDLRETWRVDMWTSEHDPKKRKFIGTCYVLAKDDFAAKKWARENHMKHMSFSSNLECNRIFPAEAIEAA